jgi:hypothetical protein
MFGARRVARAAGVLALVVASSVGASTASAHEKSPWTPTGPNEDDSVVACGTTLTIHDQKNRVESRTVDLGGGTTRTEYRGTLVTRVSAPDGRAVVLDNSGRYSETDFANGDIAYDLRAPGLIYYFDPVERAAFKKAGLPPVFYYTKGRTRLFIGDGYENVLQRPREVTSICALLKR